LKPSPSYILLSISSISSLPRPPSNHFCVPPATTGHKKKETKKKKKQIETSVSRLPPCLFDISVHVSRLISNVSLTRTTLEIYITDRSRVGKTRNGGAADEAIDVVVVYSAKHTCGPRGWKSHRRQVLHSLTSFGSLPLPLQPS
jgi:hypothetical protein